MHGQPSTSRLPRESTFPVASMDHLSSLEDCVTATEGCGSGLQQAIAKFQPGIRDLPRLTRILENQHRYLLLPQPTLATHKESLSSSLAPQIDALIERAEKAYEQNQGRRSRLEERLEILRSAPSAKARETAATASASTASTGLQDINVTGLSITQRRKIAMMKGRRERLEKEREALRT